MCPINDDFEDTEYFLLYCNAYLLLRNSLLNPVPTTLLPYGSSNLSFEELVSIILYDDDDERLPFELDQVIIKATLEFIELSRTFS